MGWVLPAVYQITLFRINYSPPIIKWVRELSFHYYSYYCSPTRKDADAPSQNDSFNDISVIYSRQSKAV